jgi:hypothetical protein
MLKHRAYGARRVVIALELTTGEHFVDEAVDVEKSDLTKYAESHFDTKYLTFKDGIEPTYFKLKSLTRNQRDAVADMNDRKAANYRVRCSLLGFENYDYKIVNADGSETDLTQPERKDGKITQAWFDNANLPDMHLVALNLIIQMLSEASFPLSSASKRPSGPAE